MAYFGYSELKTYGMPKKPVTLPQVFKGKARATVLDKVIDLLDDWRGSVFQHQGVTVAGFRSALCLRGIDWHQADNEAHTIVSEGLRAIGAIRPSWDQGQREYVTPPEYCLWCPKEIPEHSRSGGRDPRYCCVECADFALKHRYRERKWWIDDKGWAAYRMIQRQKMPERQCRQCGKGYHVERVGSTTVYCSHLCSTLARRLPEKRCTGCSLSFRPKQAGQLYCGKACFEERKRAGFECQCIECGEAFLSARDGAQFCCKGHRQRYARRMKAAPVPESNVIYLTANVFDGWFKRAA